ncbi:MAG: YcxB family protein [Gemmataceae bacterium]
MEIEYSLRPEDLQAFSRYLASLRSGQPRNSLIAVLGVVVILAVMLGIPFVGHFWGLFDRNYGLFYFFGLLVGTLGTVFILFWWVFWMLRANNKALFDEKRSNWAYQDIRVILSPNQLRTVSRASTTTYDWSVVWHIGLTRKHIFLCLTKTMSLVIPRRAFRDPAHGEEFVALARQYRQEWRELKEKSTGIITSLPPESTAITRPGVT